MLRDLDTIYYIARSSKNFSTKINFSENIILVYRGSLLKNKSRVHLPPLPPLAPPETNTNAGVHLASATSRFYLAILSRHTHLNSTKPTSDLVSTTDPKKYLRQYLADEDI